MKTLVLSLLAVAFLFASGPASATIPDPGEVDPQITDGTAARKFKEARAKWLAQGISDYRITVHRYCFCIQPSKVKVTVRSGKPVRISARPWYGPRTVPGMFRVIGQAIKRKVARLDVNYDPVLGLPRQANIDYIAMAVDDEISYRITGFKRLKN